MRDKILERYAERVGYTQLELDTFQEGGHRVRCVENLFKAAPKYSIVVEVVHSKHCNSGHVVGQKLVMDVDGNFVTKLCPPRMCVYLLSQLTLPVALINERLTEGLTPNEIHFGRMIRCPDPGVNCLGYGEVMAKVEVVERIKG